MLGRHVFISEGLSSGAVSGQGSPGVADPGERRRREADGSVWGVVLKELCAHMLSSIVCACVWCVSEMGGCA